MTTSAKPKKKYPPRPFGVCSCSAARNVEGLCPFGCDKFRKPHLSRIQGDHRAKVREKRGNSRNGW